MPHLADFEGDWTLERDVDDRRAGRRGRLAGHVRFRRSGGGLLLQEDGWLSLTGSAPLRATRRYLWRGEPIVAVAFADGRPFHAFDLSLDRPTAAHRCGEDLYRVSYDFTRWPVWTTVWAVKGPRKDYTLASRNVRLDACATDGRRAEPRATIARE